MDILMVAQYFGNIERLDESNNRFVYLSKMLANQHHVEVLTTSFVHAIKKQGANVPTDYYGCKITALTEPGYPKNVCLKRFYSHRILSKRMKAYLDDREKPDVIYCAVPSLDCAEAAAQYAKRNRIPFILDIQDLWPEAFKMVFRVPVLKDVLFFPMKKKADRIYAAADHIVGVSQTYCDRAKQVNPHALYTPVFIGTNLAVFDRNAKANMVKREDDKLVVGYCGTLGHSYDLRCIFDAMQIVQSEGYNHVELWIMGRGPLEQSFRQYAAERNVNVKFLGWMPYERMCGVLSSCDVCINPITKGTAASIINKHADYAAAGLPVINTQESAEYRKLVSDYQCGINCDCADARDVANAMMLLADNEHERTRMGINARRLAEERFNRSHTYGQIERLIRKQVSNSATK